MSGSENAGGEPSMDEILASIRRILHEDERIPLGSGAEPEDVPETPESVLVLDDTMMVPEREAPVGETEARPLVAAVPLEGDVPPELDAQAEIVQVPREDEHRDQHQIFQEADMSGKTEGPRGLIGENTAESASSHLGALTRTLSAERSVALSRGGPTLEDIVRDELRPLLSSWLDAHLPGLVERVVRAEIERLVARTEI